MTTDPGAIVKVCIGLHARRAARRVSRRFDAALAPHRLDISQFNLLSVIATLDDPTLVTVAAILDVDSSTVSRTLKPLRDMDLVHVRGSRGRRGLTVALSLRGRDVYTAATGAWMAVQSELAHVLGEARIGRILEALEQLEHV